MEKVRDIVKNAFAALPDQSENDNKMIISGVNDTKHQTKNGDDSEDTGCNPLDRLMCNIIDKM